MFPKPPYYPGLAPADFYLFLKLKILLKEKRFDSTGDIKVNTETVLNNLKKKNFQECSQKWKHRWSTFSLKGTTLKEIHRNSRYMLPFRYYKNSLKSFQSYLVWPSQINCYRAIYRNRIVRTNKILHICTMNWIRNVVQWSVVKIQNCNIISDTYSKKLER